MDCNINRNILDNYVTGDRVLNHSKSFQDRKIKKYKNKNLSTIESDDFRIIKNSKIKNSFKSYDDHSIMDKETKRINHVYSDTFSYKCSNTDKPIKNPSPNIDWKPLLNSKEYSLSANINVIKRSPKSKETPDRSANVFRSCKYQYHRNSYDTKGTSNFSQQNRSSIPRKFNFLQESQLNFSDKCDASSNNSKDTCCTTNSSQTSLKTSNGVLNPAAQEFTPSSTSLTSLSPIDISNAKPPMVNVIENGLKSLSLCSENAIPTISNPIVIDSSELSYTNPPLALFSTEPAHYNKFGVVDPQFLVHNLYQYTQGSLARPLSRVNYPNPTQIIPQFPLTLYGTQPQLIRYNPPAPNIQGGYLVYNPVMINGMYNHCIGTPLLTNRIVSIGSADIQTGATANIAHPLNSNVTLAAFPHFYTDSINNASLSHIR